MERINIEPNIEEEKTYERDKEMLQGIKGWLKEQIENFYEKFKCYLETL